MDKESVTRVSAPCAGCNGVDGGDETASVTPTETGSIRRIEEAGARAGEGKSETAEARGLIEADGREVVPGRVDRVGANRPVTARCWDEGRRTTIGANRRGARCNRVDEDEPKRASQATP